MSKQNSDPSGFLRARAGRAGIFKRLVETMRSKNSNLNVTMGVTSVNNPDSKAFALLTLSYTLHRIDKVELRTVMVDVLCPEDKVITFSNFSNGQVFHGYMDNLEVYNSPVK